MDISNFGNKNKTYIMGILNITPDSFSDGGQYCDIDASLRQAEKMVSEGVHIIDVGGESTRPGFTPVDAEEEAARVIPVIKELRKYFNIPISVDTYKSSVARKALEAGADIVNDIWGFRQDPQMAHVVAEYGAMCVLTHNSDDTFYGDLVQDDETNSNEMDAADLSDEVPEDEDFITEETDPDEIDDEEYDENENTEEQDQM